MSSNPWSLIQFGGYKEISHLSTLESVGEKGKGQWGKQNNPAKTKNKHLVG